MTPLIATYRLQLGADLTFADATALVPYLRDLGVSHLYLSPIMRARTGSTHGYDVVDPRRVSDVLGGEAGLRALAAAGLPLIVDTVPNHMAASDENPFWSDEGLRSQFFDLDPAGGHRRFFDIDDLVGVRMEDPDVFAATHATLLALVGDGVIAGVRVDHVDGLADPAGYLQRLHDAGVERVWVEKILEPGEALPPWPVTGTTGYDFLVDADALFVDPAGERALDVAVGERPPFAERARAAKADQVRTTFQPEVARLRRIADVEQLEEALVALPVYRTYIDPDTGACSDQDVRALTHLPASVAGALVGPDAAPEFVTRFQQTTGAVMAKGVEDTAMYRDVRLLALNEVGGDPDRFGITVDHLHRGNEQRATHWPEALLAATTHDTKRSADVRARLLVLPTIGEAWLGLVTTWRELCAAHGAVARGAPDADEQLFVLQTLVGAWPISTARLDEYLLKALREAKRNTAWVDGDEAWERAVLDVTHRVLADERFGAALEPVLAAVVDGGERIALGELVLRCLAPGVPDLYQGDELWNHLLVDPDNRRPVDWELRRATLRELRDGAPLDRANAKLFATRALLEVRTRLGGFADLAYQPLAAPADVCAFARGDDLVAVVPTRPRVTLPSLADLGHAADGWTDVLAPLDAVYGERRPAVYARVDPGR